MSAKGEGTIPGAGTAPVVRSHARRGRPRAGAVRQGPERRRAARGDAPSVSVVPNTAYRHFADRDALLAAIRDEAIGALAERSSGMRRGGSAAWHAAGGYRLRLRAVGHAYLEFARTRTGPLRDRVRAPRAWPSEGPPTRAAQRHRSTISSGGPRQSVGARIEAGGPNIEYPIWASVHGLAVLLRGPLRSLPKRGQGGARGSAARRSSRRP